jgi:hypothetical protein
MSADSKGFSSGDAAQIADYQRIVRRPLMF